MGWWQIALIILSSIVIGILGGILVYYLVRRLVGVTRSRFLVNRSARWRLVRRRQVASVAEEPEREISSTFNGPRHEMPSMATGKKDKAVPRMVPIFSLKCIIVIAIGFIIGAGLGVGYWAVSPVSIGSGWPPIKLSGISDQSPTLYECTVGVRIMSRGISDTSLKALQYQGQYYEAKMNAFPFFEFLSEKIAEQAPQYSCSPDELVKMVSVRYDWSSANPGTVEVVTVSTNASQAYFIASIIPEVFEEHLIAEEHNIRLEEYQNTVKEVESTRAALLEAEKELAALTQQQNVYDISLDPAYIELTAQISGLESALDFQADELAVLIAEGNVGSDYIDTLQAMERTSIALSKARSELASLEASSMAEQASEEYLQQRLAYTATSSKVEKLNRQLSSLSQSLASLATENGAELQMFSFEAKGEPSIPTAIPPERVRGRNALMMGAVLGMAGSWVVLNRKWLVNEANGIFSSAGAAPLEDEEDGE